MPHASLMHRGQERGHSNATTALMSFCKFGKKDINILESLVLDLIVNTEKKKMTYEERGGIGRGSAHEKNDDKKNTHTHTLAGLRKALLLTAELMF